MKNSQTKMLLLLIFGLVQFSHTFTYNPTSPEVADTVVAGPNCIDTRIIYINGRHYSYDVSIEDFVASTDDALSADLTIYDSQGQEISTSILYYNFNKALTAQVSNSLGSCYSTFVVQTLQRA